MWKYPSNNQHTRRENSWRGWRRIFLFVLIFRFRFVTVFVSQTSIVVTCSHLLIWQFLIISITRVNCKTEQLSLLIYAKRQRKDFASLKCARVNAISRKSAETRETQISQLSRLGDNKININEQSVTWRVWSCFWAIQSDHQWRWNF